MPRKKITLPPNTTIVNDEAPEAPLFTGAAPAPTQAPFQPPPVAMAAFAPAPVKPPVVTHKIILDESPEIPPTGLFMGHNGRHFMLKTGVPLDAPDYLLEILDHAITKVPVVHPSTQKVIDYRDKPRFPYRYLSNRVA